MHTLANRKPIFVLCLILMNGLSACVPTALTAAGLGGGTAISHTLNGITYRTFTVPSGKVKGATITALNRMGIKVVSNGKLDKSDTDVIKAKANDRDIEVQLEPLTPNTTRMRVTAKSDGLFYDSATSTEIILQTERVLGNS